MTATLQCELCPRGCVIAPGQSGDCRIRVNLDGELVAVTYGYPCSVHVDPMEKKPVFHFLPGTPTLSLATAGCNLHCKNCQNWEISQQPPDEVPALHLPPGEVAALAGAQGCPSVSYTYTEPLVYYEYTLDSCRRVREAGRRNVLVSAGYINPQPARHLFQQVDVARIDLKALSDAFYRDICGATLKPVQATLVLAREMGLWVEVVHLIIPTLNDSDQDLGALCRWVHDQLGPETPVHFSRFYPQYRMSHLPPTPVDTLHRARDIAKANGLAFVYLGNILEEHAADTVCPGCQTTLIRRRGFTVLANLLQDGQCPKCQRKIPGIWS